MDQLEFLALNLAPSTEPPAHAQLSEFFTLTARPSTSLWRQPRSISIATAPMILAHLTQPFVVAEVTISADFEMEWDQGGLIIFSGSCPYDPTVSPVSGRRRRHSCCNNECEGRFESGKWVKAGLELTGGHLHASTTVATKESGADWSTCPVFPETYGPGYDTNFHGFSLRMKLERIGDSLEVWYRIPNIHGTVGGYHSQREPSPQSIGQQWRKLREVQAFFSGLQSKENVWVGCFASRPIATLEDDETIYGSVNEDEFVVEFDELEII